MIVSGSSMMCGRYYTRCCGCVERERGVSTGGGGGGMREEGGGREGGGFDTRLGERERRRDE